MTRTAKKLSVSVSAHVLTCLFTRHTLSLTRHSLSFSLFLTLAFFLSLSLSFSISLSHYDGVHICKTSFRGMTHTPFPRHDTHSLFKTRSLFLHFCLSPSLCLFLCLFLLFSVSLAQYGDVHIYKTSFRGMKHTLTKREQKTLMKLIVHPETDKVSLTRNTSRTYALTHSRSLYLTRTRSRSQRIRPS